MAVQAHGRNDGEYGGLSGRTRVVHNCDGRLVAERKEDERKDKDGARPCLRLFSVPMRRFESRKPRLGLSM